MSCHDLVGFSQLFTDYIMRMTYRFAQLNGCGSIALQVYRFQELALYTSLQPLGLGQILNPYPLYY